MRYVFFAIAVVLLLSVAVAPSYAVGKYCLAYWRECGYNEKGGTGGTHIVNIHVWDESGNPVANKTIYTDSGTYMATTDANGCAEAPIYEPNSYPLKVVDGTKLSDVTPGFSSYRAPDWGHYSFSCGFMYKSDSANTGTFDTSYRGVFNSTAAMPCDLSAPCTNSLAFYSTKSDMGYYCSDARGIGNSAASVGQTFVATGNRVIACQVHAYVGWPTKYVARIRAGGPSGSYVGSSATSPDTSDVNWLKTQTKWGKDAVQVTPGQTYYLEITKYGGGDIRSYRVTNDNYSSGCYYEGTTAYTGYELEASIVCATVGTPSVGTIAGNVKDTGGTNISGVTVQTSTGGYSATTDASGNYTISNVTPGTYDVSASKTGYVAGTQTGKTVTANATTTVNFTLSPNVGTITGNVKDSSSQNISGATVSTNTGGYSTTTDASGNYTLSNVASGSYTVTASKSGYNSSSNNVSVSAGQTVTSNFTLTPNTNPFTGVVNGNFEGAFNNDPDVDHKTAASWHGVNIGTQNAKWGGYYGTYHSANWSQAAWESNYTVAYYQQCPNATVGSSYTASVWVRGSNTALNFWVGIDPTGGTSATSANIQWSAVSTPGTTWTQISKSATASSTSITMFIKAQNTTAGINYAYIDDATFVGP